MSRVISRLIRRTASDRSVGAWRCAGRRGVREELITGLRGAAWLRVEHGPLERERERGPFEVESLGGSAALATGDLLVCERHAHIQELPEEDASVEEFARYAAGAPWRGCRVEPDRARSRARLVDRPAADRQS